MNRDDIRKMIQANNLTRTSEGLLGVIVRLFEQLQDLDEKMKDGSITETDLHRLMSENATLEQGIINTNAAIVQAEKEADAAQKKTQDEFRALKRKGLEIDEHIKALEGECDGIRQEMKNLTDKPSDMKRLKGKLEDLRKENNDLQLKLGNLGEGYQANAELYKRRKAFVEKLEAHEERLSKTMNEIWQGLKKDAFDKSMKDGRIN
ncbi:MAG: hypothetical protein IKP58_13530 [Victivallales bacterium]|nr:hypothetical protein [Victivallales bacterium]